MDKRIAKRHKRQVERARMHVKTSEPDVRTHEQIEADRAASRPEGIVRDSSPAAGNTRSLRSSAATSTGSSAKTGA